MIGYREIADILAKELMADKTIRSQEELSSIIFKTTTTLILLLCAIMQGIDTQDGKFSKETIAADISDTVFDNMLERILDNLKKLKGETNATQKR